jgi:hypothetical protein
MSDQGRQGKSRAVEHGRGPRGVKCFGNDLDLAEGGMSECEELVGWEITSDYY